jgi:hypothetical protein
MPEQRRNMRSTIQYGKMDVGHVFQNLSAWAVQTPSERSSD